MVAKDEPRTEAGLCPTCFAPATVQRQDHLETWTFDRAEAARLALDGVRRAVERLRYSQPLGPFDSVPQMMWRRNEDTIDHLLAAIEEAR